MRKLIISINIISLINLISCYYQKQMNPYNYSFDENNTMKVITKDSVYNFEGNDYYLEKDTLFGTAFNISGESTSPEVKVAIPIDNMKALDVERFDYGGTVLTVLGVAFGIFLIVVTVGLAQSDWR